MAIPLKRSGVTGVLDARDVVRRSQLRNGGDRMGGDTAGKRQVVPTTPVDGAQQAPRIGRESSSKDRERVQ
jgi:hypothetical protein